jgi:hypothetical protein
LELESVEFLATGSDVVTTVGDHEIRPVDEIRSVEDTYTVRELVPERTWRRSTPQSPSASECSDPSPSGR